MDSGFSKLLGYLKLEKYIVAFTGAGMSTASGLPDYRGPNGLWTLKSKGVEPAKPAKPWSEHDPNPGHLALTQLVRSDIINFVISQNVDGLHLKSGMKMSNIAELHGNSTIMRCVYCDSRYNTGKIGWKREIHGRGRLDDPVHPSQPVCLSCGGRLISTIVDFGDPLPQTEMRRARTESIRAEIFLVLGSSLSVYPAASLPKVAKSNGAKLIIINKGPTKRDNLADLVINADLSILLPRLVEYL